MPMGPDSNPNTASAIGPTTTARLEHGPLGMNYTTGAELQVETSTQVPNYTTGAEPHKAGAGR